MSNTSAAEIDFDALEADIELFRVEAVLDGLVPVEFNGHLSGVDQGGEFSGLALGRAGDGDGLVSLTQSHKAFLSISRLWL